MGVTLIFVQYYVSSELQHEKQMFNHLDSVGLPVGQIEQTHKVRPKIEALTSKQPSIDIERSEHDNDMKRRQLGRSLNNH